MPNTNASDWYQEAKDLQSANGRLRREAERYKSMSELYKRDMELGDQKIHDLEEELVSLKVRARDILHVV